MITQGQSELVAEKTNFGLSRVLVHEIIGGICPQKELPEATIGLKSTPEDEESTSNNKIEDDNLLGPQFKAFDSAASHAIHLLDKYYYAMFLQSSAYARFQVSYLICINKWHQTGIILLGCCTFRFKCITYSFSLHSFTFLQNRLRFVEMLP